MQRHAAPSMRAMGIGVIGVAAITLALVWMLGDGGEAPSAPPPVDRALGDVEAGGGEPGIGLDPGTPSLSPEAARELAAHLARALDGGVRPARPTGAPGTADPGAADPGAAGAPGEPRTTLRIDRPVTPSEQADYAAGLHDWIVIRRDDLRHRLAQLEESGQGDSDLANRVRWEIERLDHTEPSAERQAQELTERARREAEQAPTAPQP